MNCIKTNARLLIIGPPRKEIAHLCQKGMDVLGKVVTLKSAYVILKSH